MKNSEELGSSKGKVYSPGRFARLTDVSVPNELARFGETCESQPLQSDLGFKGIAENAYEGIVVNASVDGPYVYANRRAGDISGYTISELLQIGPQQLLPPNDYAQVKRIMEKRLRGREIPERYETGILHKDGKIVPVEMSGSKTLWNEKPAALILFRDITLRKKIEAERTALNQQLERRVREQTLELSEVALKLARNRDELEAHQAELERANKEVAQTNAALTVLARNIDKKCNELEKKIAHSISSKMFPLIEEMQNENIPERSRNKLELLSLYLRDLTPGASKSREVIVSLSSMELRIAMMIKKGFSTDEIARLLFISPHTVKTHRKTIRKKLNIQNNQINLYSYLNLKLS
jgi:PAS domain S-box-containing protein